MLVFQVVKESVVKLFKLLLQKPILSMLDEPESGVDLQSVHVLGKALSSLQHNTVNGIQSATISFILFDSLDF